MPQLSVEPPSNQNSTSNGMPVRPAEKVIFYSARFTLNVIHTICVVLFDLYFVYGISTFKVDAPAPIIVFIGRSDIKNIDDVVLYFKTMICIYHIHFYLLIERYFRG